jgi:tungstate transport system substrate-binding protein
LVNPTKHLHVKQELGQALVDWITGPEGQAAIASYKINREQLFFPNTIPEPMRSPAGAMASREETL